MPTGTNADFVVLHTPHLLTRTVHICLLQAPFLVFTSCTLGLKPDKFEVLDGSSTPKRVFLTVRRFNLSQPV